MGVSNSIDVVPPEEGVREFAERVLQAYDLFNMTDPLMCAQELERYPTLHVFKAGLPEDYSPQITTSVTKQVMRKPSMREPCLAMSITALNSAALHHNYASLLAVNSVDLIQELNNEPDADLSYVPEPLFPLGSAPTGLGSPSWSIEIHVPNGDKDPVDSQKVFKAPEGWTICAHHPLMVDAAHARVFIDDVLIFTKDLETHLKVVAKLFATFKLVNLKAHPGKSRICFPCIEYLGHNIVSLGLTPNEVKVAAIIALPNPSNISELRRVLGFANYYRGYVPHSSEIAKPLTDLLKKDVKWEWTAERASAWRDLKDALCCPYNALRHPDRNVRYVLHTDWSQKGLSAVLGQVDPETGTTNSSELTLRVAASPFGDVVHSICNAPVPDCCISAIHTDGVRVIELFGGMVSGLDCLLRKGVKILQYSYCDLSHHVRAVAHHMLTQLIVKYPDQLPQEAWSSAFAALPQDVYAITEEHLSFAGALEEDPILLIARFECADLSLAGSRKGLQGSKSSTFYPLLSVLASLQRMRSSYAFPLANLIENTATQYAYSSSRAMKDSFHELCAKIGSPILLDAANVGSYAHRMRNYWTNLVSSSVLQCVLDSFEHDPDLNLFYVLYTTNPQICTKARSYPWCTANVPGKLLKVLPTLVARVDSYAFRSRPDGEGQGQVLDEA
ncbi:hypothetical protein CEUSTIGMA_g804.t1 [Chlamydomonas eustigma]|uniref:Reverse transcriptase/retrotransposon-derived protein RNase H-like domain-containing protein n=1 Tax=Chlamydomonas eustigma TaxID=1157962 RepID=A0A250WRD0_9CHLO|nr:hypothetical protein CEUSTIGMA_g804.t1 [Chlamydomonas eustigma]|eukprot:GAX73351.1 hypothetical protein CEUSTIGMA_g804.t1 [Chlamydomonas eustigma]